MPQKGKQKIISVSNTLNRFLRMKKGKMEIKLERPSNQFIRLHRIVG